MVVLTNLVSGLLFVGLSIPLLKGKIKMNAAYGVRFPSSYQSDEAWYNINKYGAKQLIIWSIPLFITAIIAAFLQELSELVHFLLVILPCIVIIFPVMQTYLYAKKQ